MRETKPVWTSSSFLVYTGGLTVLAGGGLALGYLSGHYGSGAKAGWALLVLVILYVLAHVFRVAGRQVAAGIFAFAAVIAWAAFLVFLFEWWGWNGVNGSFSHWSWSRLALWLLILAAAWDDRRRFGFPFIRVISAVVGWLFVVDLITAGGNFTAVLTLLVGIAYLLWGAVHRTPSSFWLHVVGGLLIGGAILYWAHTGDAEWAAVSIAALCFVVIAYATRRSSWAVLGTIGFFAATIHYLVGSPTALAEGAFGLGDGERAPAVSPWAPALAVGLLGFWLVLLGLLGRRQAAAPAEPPPA
ncbi:MAG: hypothetical protein ACJ75G_13015 [Gaiellaceae bacterium]